MTKGVTRILIGAVATTVLLGLAAAAIGFGGRSRGGPPTGGPPATAEVTRQTLTDFAETDGTVSFGAALSLRYTPPVAVVPPSTTSGGTAGGPPGDGGSAGGPAGGAAQDSGQHLITWLAPVGLTVERGQPVFRVDDRPVVLLYGPLPVYRTLAAGTRGADVRQLETNLVALGYVGITVDDDFTAATANAVKRWQRNVGLGVTGTVAPGQVLDAAGGIRVDSYTLHVGDPAAGEVLRYTGTTRQVTARLPIGQQQYASPGGRVQLTLPDGRSTTGTVASVGQPDAPDGGGERTVPVLVTAADQNALGTAAAQPVAVRFVADRREDALTVPVTALVALAEGGYGVQVVDGASVRYVAVRTGLFANGFVEVDSDQIHAGTKVVVPG
jgi:peptidoglycan hydrolase-like protein with peptidoglycan-binding domain